MTIPKHLIEAKICNVDTCKLANTIPTNDDKSNMIAKLVIEKAELQSEIERLNNIINELEKDIKNLYTYGIKNNAEQKDYLLNRLDGLRQAKELKEGK